MNITFVPQVNAAHPGMVIILARFTAADETVSGLNFQAAVPKVCFPETCRPLR